MRKPAGKHAEAGGPFRGRRLPALLLAVCAAAIPGLAAPSGAAAQVPDLGGYLEGVLDDLTEGSGLGEFLKDATCPVAEPLDEVGQQLPPLDQLTGALVTVSCNLDLLDFTFHTEFKRPDGTVIRRDTPAIVDVPAPLDVDDQPGADLLGTIQVTSLDEVSVIVERMPGVMKPLPVSVEIVLDDPSRGSLPREEIAFGYDTKESSAPINWRTTLRLEDVFGNPDPLRVGIDFATKGPGESLAVIGELFNRAPDGSRADRMQGRVSFAPVPDGVSVDLALGERIEALLRSTEAATVDALVAIAEGDDQQRIEAHIGDLPRQAQFAFERPADDELRVDYDAVAPIANLDATVTDRAGAPRFETVESTARFNVRDVPLGITARQTGPRSGRVTTRGGPIGKIDGAIASGGEPIVETTPGHYLKVLEDEGFSSLAFRILGVERVAFDGSSPILVDAVLEPGPVRAAIDTPELQARASIRDLPHDLRLLIDPDQPRVIYDGNGAVIDELSLEAESPTPFFERVRRIDASVDDIPSSVQLDLEQRDGGIAFLADNPIGRIEALATSGPGERLPAGEQGVIFRDEEDRYLAFARVFGLREVAFEPDPLEAVVRLGAGRAFSADATIQEPGDDLDAVASIENLPKRVELSLDDGADTSLTYDADEPIGRLFLEAHNLPLIDRAGHVKAEVTDVPVHIDVALPADGPVVSANASDPIGSIKAQLADAGFEELDPGRDGVIFYDTANRFAVTAEVSGLRGLEFGTDPNIDATLDVPGGTNPFDFDVQMQEFPEEDIEYFQGTVDSPQRDTHIDVLTDPNLEFNYSAGGAISSITLLSNIGDLGLIDVELQNLARNLGVCFHSGANCVRAASPHQDAIVSVDIDDQDAAIGPVEIDGLICLEPKSDVDCMQNPSKFVTIDDLTLREFALDAKTDGLSTGAFVDTDNRDVTGEIEYRDPGLPVIDGARIDLPTGFRAQNRQAGIFSSSGSIVCPSGTFIGTISPDIDLAGLLC